MNLRLLKDDIARKATFFLTLLSCLILFLIILGLYRKSEPILAVNSLNELLFSSSWFPFKGKFGFLSFILGTLWVTILAMVIATPFSLLTAIYLSEYANRIIREIAKPLIDLLSGIPSVVYGVCGVIVVVPFIKEKISPLFGIYSSGYCILAGGIVLAVMIFPTIIHVSTEVFSSVSYEMGEASLSVGATKWQTIKKVLLRKALPGIIASLVLGLSRAFGETMAVLMVVGNVAIVPKSVFDPAYPLPALIANNYGEIMSIPLYESAIMFASFILLIIVLVFNILARAFLVRAEKKAE